VVRHFHQALNPQHFAKYKHLLLCPSIAYIKNHQAIFGLVYAPLTQTHYYGFDNKTYKQHNNIQTPLTNTKFPSLF
jgi:fructose-1,6-bisphosphatase/inositol monophosphatase family enzyme